MNNITFGEFLRALRESRMLSQKELADKANIDPSHLNKIEKGTRMPSDDVLFRLADVLVAAELFQAAGRIIPPEFEKKYPSKRSSRIKKLKEFKKSIPNTLKKLLAIYQNQYDTIVNKSKKMENDIRVMEKIISSNTDLYTSFKKQVNDPKCQELISITDSIINTNYTLTGNMWDLELISWQEGTHAGKMEAVSEIWSEINKIIEEDLTSFITDFLKIERNDAELVAEIVKVIKKRGKPSTT